MKREKTHPFDLNREKTCAFVRIAVLSLSLTFSSFVATAGEILLREKVSLLPVAVLTNEQARTDLKDLVQILETAYGGRGVLPPQQFEKLIQALNSLSQLQKEWSSDSLCDAVAELTEKVSDFHLTVQIANRTCGRVWPKATGGNNVAFGGANPTWALKPINHNGASVEVLGIQKMTNSDSDQWDGFGEAVRTLVQKDRPFVIDLRGNPGGDVRMGLKLAQFLYGVENEKMVPWPEKTIYRKLNPTARSLFANSYWLQKQAFEDRGQLVPPEILTAYQNAVSDFKKALNHQVPWTQTEQLGKTLQKFPNLFSKPVFVLVNKNCGSSCELTLEVLENHPFVSTIGERSTGVVQYGNVGTAFLRESHLVVHIPTQGSIYRDARQVEKVGYQPKIEVPNGENFLDFTLKRFF